MTSEYWILFVFVAYFAVLIGISIVRARQMDNMSDYVLGGRKMGSFTSALSAASSASSGWTMLVFPALAFAAGLIHLDCGEPCAGPLARVDPHGAASAPLHHCGR